MWRTASLRVAGRLFDNAHGEREHHEHAYVGDLKQSPAVTDGDVNGAQFIPADQDWADAAAWRALHHERRAVVIVAEDHELVLSPRRRSPLLRPLDGLLGSAPVLVRWRLHGARPPSAPYAVATHVGRHPLGRMRELACA